MVAVQVAIDLPAMTGSIVQLGKLATVPCNTVGAGEGDCDLQVRGRPLTLSS